MRINLIYEINNREYINCVLLERELLRRGYDVHIYSRFEDYVTSGEESWTLIPNSYHTGDVDRYNYCFRARNRLILYPCEQVVNHKLPEIFDHSDQNAAKRLPCLCWGPDYYEFIRSLGFDMSQSAITGAVQLDFCRPEFRSFFLSRKEMAERFRLPEDRRWILFVSDFVFADEKMTERIIGFGEQAPEPMRHRHRFEERELRELLGWFERYLREHSDCIIIYRKHPVEDLIAPVKELAARYPGRFCPIGELNIKEWISNADAIATWNSTAGIECYAAGKDIALLRPEEFPPETGLTDYSFYKDYPRLRDYESFEREMAVREHPEWKSHFKIDDLYSIEERPAFLRVADAMEAILKAGAAPGVEADHEKKRLLFLIQSGTLLKSAVKKSYQWLYLHLGLRDIPALSSRFALEVWRDSADNAKAHAVFARKIDEILAEHYPMK